MNKRVEIKLCGFTRLEDVFFAANLDIDAMGFVFYAPSPRYVVPDKAAELIAAAQKQNANIASVALFVNETADLVKEIAKFTKIDVLQFHGTESPEYCDALSQSLGLPYLKAVHVKPDTNTEDLVKSALPYKNARAILLDTASSAWGGTGKSFEWSIVPASLEPRLVLSGGLSAQNIPEALRTLKPAALDTSSGIESAKGIKDAAKMTAFVNAVRQNAVRTFSVPTYSNEVYHHEPIFKPSAGENNR